MGSMISLSVGAIDIDWGKNRGFVNHAVLFQRGDEGLGPYHYVNDDGTPHIQEQRCLTRSLGKVVPRLELLGYTLDNCQNHLEGWQGEDEDPMVSLTAFKSALSLLPWRERGEYVDFDEAVREAYAKSLESEGMEPGNPGMLGWERYLDPYLVMRVLAEIPEFEDLPVRWNFADVLEGGWTTEEDVAPSGPAARWVIVTEGSTDTLILQRSVQELHPDVADFFDFIDMKEGNPFPGVGSIVTFCRGLSRIGYDGHMLVVLDNDTAGQAAKQDIDKLTLAPSVRVTCLPDLEDLRSIVTIGPTGSATSDINGRASAIECFLDFGGVERPPQVRLDQLREAPRFLSGRAGRQG